MTHGNATGFDSNQRDSDESSRFNASCAAEVKLAADVAAAAGKRHGFRKELMETRGGGAAELLGTAGRRRRFAPATSLLSVVVVNNPFDVVEEARMSSASSSGHDTTLLGPSDMDGTLVGEAIKKDSLFFVEVAAFADAAAFWSFSGGVSSAGGFRMEEGAPLASPRATVDPSASWRCLFAPTHSTVPAATGGATTAAVRPFLPNASVGCAWAGALPGCPAASSIALVAFACCCLLLVAFATTPPPPPPGVDEGRCCSTPFFGGILEHGQGNRF